MLPESDKDQEQFPIMCSYETCKNVVPSFQNGIIKTKYCRYHVCKYSDCSELIVPNSLACNAHRCQVSNCPDIIRYDYRSQTTVCSRHLCKEWECQQTTTLGSVYCHKHIKTC